jgi:hypothetical protein
MPRPSSSTLTELVGVQRDLDLLAVAGQGLVGRVVQHFLDDVQRVVGAGVHARPLLDGLQALEHADRAFGVGSGGLLWIAMGADCMPWPGKKLYEHTEGPSDAAAASVPAKNFNNCQSPASAIRLPSLLQLPGCRVLTANRCRS